MKIATVIPAYNEENTVVEVVRVVKLVTIIDEVIVVSDGSTDATAQKAYQAGARVVDLPYNIGKGGAMLEGVNSTDAEIILFLDADLLGLTPKHVIDLLKPVVMGEVQMTIGIFENGRLATDLAQFVAPYLSGQRAMLRTIVDNISNVELSRFGIEVVLTNYVKKHKIPVRTVCLADMTHVMKEEKLGLVPGIKARMKMYWEIAKSIAGE